MRSPVLDYTTSSDECDIILAAGHECDDEGAGDPGAGCVRHSRRAGLGGHYVVLSVRSADHYAIGHIPGAINIPWRQVAKVDNLTMLDPDKTIIVYCCTGHTGGVATTALNMMGYDAVNMKHGIMSWTRDAAVRVIDPFIDANDAHDYPTEP